MAAWCRRKRSRKKQQELGRRSVELLKRCAQTRDLQQAMALHQEIAGSAPGPQLLSEDPYVASAVISMYAKCGSLAKAQAFMDELPHPDAVCWSALIAGYAQDGQPLAAFSCFKRMMNDHIPPPASIFTCILKSIGHARDLALAEAIHDEIDETGFLKKDAFLGAALVNMYAKCGLLAKAQQVFDELPIRDAVTWTTLVTGYAQQGHSEEALKCFERMRGEGFAPDAIALPCILKAIGSVRAIEKGEEIHQEILRQGFLKTNDIVLATALVDMYAKCGSLKKARQVFDDLPVRNLVLWTALITGYVQQGQINEAFACYQDLLKEGLVPDVVTFSCILNACGSARAIAKGEEIHNELVRRGLLDKDSQLGVALMDMYAKCGALAKARQVFDELLTVRTPISWTTLISAYLQAGQCDDALQCFEQMRCEGSSLDSVTLGCMLKACSILGAYEKGKQIHNDIITRGFLRQSIDLGAALVDMYAKCGTLVKARQVFEELPRRHLITWNALIAGYAQHGRVEEASDCFRLMQDEGMSPDAMSFALMLNACGNGGSIEKGRQIHDEVVRARLLGKDAVLSTALVHMYAKCGLLEKAQQVFDEIPDKNIASWTALIAGYAQHGRANEAFKCCEKMEDEGLSPNDVTFLCVLNACSHSGLLDESQMLFEKMNRRYGITPNLDHHTCMVDVFGRAGHFDKALSLIYDMLPSSNFLPLWHSLLGACKRWGNVKLGRFAFDQVVRVDNRDTAAYVLMANIYASAGMHEDAENIEAMRAENSA